MTTPTRARKTHFALLITFMLIIGGIGLINTCTSCSTIKSVNEPVKAELTGCEKSYGYIDHTTLSWMSRKRDRDPDCPVVTTLHCKLYEEDNDILIIKICGEHYFKKGEQVLVEKRLHTNYCDHRRYVIINGWKYKMLE